MTFPITSEIVWQSPESPPKNDHLILILYSNTPNDGGILRGEWHEGTWRDEEYCEINSDEVKAWAEMPKLPL